MVVSKKKSSEKKLKNNSKTNQKRKDSKKKDVKKNTNSLIREMFDKAFYKNSKLREQASKNAQLIKTKSDANKYFNKFKDLEPQKFIKKLPLILYTLIIADTSLGMFSISSNPDLRMILSSKGNPLNKLSQLLVYVRYHIGNKSARIFDFIRLFKLINSMNNPRSKYNFSDPEVIANFLVFSLENYKNAGNDSLFETYKKMYINYMKNKEMTQNQLKYFLLLQDLLRCNMINTDESCSIVSTEISPDLFKELNDIKYKTVQTEIISNALVESVNQESISNESLLDNE